MKEKVEYHGQKVYIPTSGSCFIKRMNYFTNKDYTEKFRDFIRNEQYRSGVITSRIQPFCKKYNINIGCFDEKRINPRNITHRNKSLFIYNNHFCLIWKSNGTSFNQAIEELTTNHKVSDNLISDKHAKSFVKYEYDRKKVQSPLTKIIVYDLATYNEDKAIPYCSCIYQLSKICGKYNRDETEKEYQRCPKHCIVFI